MTIRGPYRQIDTFALLDDGSTISLIDAETARKIGAKGNKLTISIESLLSDGPMNIESETVNLTLENNGQTYGLTNVHTITNLRLPEQTLTREMSMDFAKYGTIEFYERAMPTLLIGQDNAKLLMIEESRCFGNNAFFVSKTPLGWVAHGNAGRKGRNRGKEIVGAIIDGKESENLDENEQMTQMMREYFQLDSLGIVNRERVSANEKRAREILIKTTKITNGTWETGLLWKDGNIDFGESKKNAERRLKNVEARLDRDKEYALLYVKEMQRLFDLKYAEKVTDFDATERIWYLPHFGVTNANKPGKIRLVFDAAAKSNGSCLNDRLLPGPDLLQSLWGVLTRFREGRIAYKGDMRDMFLKIKLKESDKNAQRFLWRDMNRTIAPIEYKMSTLLFGSKASPCSALYVKNVNATTMGSSNTEAARRIDRQSYVDDFIDSSDDVESATKMIMDVRNINKRGGFEMHGWACSDPEVLNGIPDIEKISGKNEFCTSGQTAKDKVLGLNWDTKADNFYFAIRQTLFPDGIFEGTRKPTKREFLRIIMSIFDPLGLLAPFVIQSKILMQEIWVSGVDWDETIRDEEFESWKKWLRDLNNVNNFQIPRCFSKQRNHISITELHIFCDASAKAYAAVAYLRFQHENGEIETVLVAAKSRVAPLKPTSIPRLELQGALIASRLAKTIEKENQIKISQKVFWTDSKTVLAWINADARRFQIFVSHRLAEIGDLTAAGEWRWVPTDLNVADSATRTAKFGKKEREEWISGPRFLKQKAKDWPSDAEIKSKYREKVGKNELRKNFVGITINRNAVKTHFPSADQISSWPQIIRATAVLWRAIDKFRGAEGNRVNVEHMRKAEKSRVKAMQRDSFAKEIKCLREKREINKDSKIKKLSPYLDDEDIIRIKSRFGDDPKEDPIILDGAAKETRLLIEHVHIQMQHGSHETLINELRQKYWITQLRVRLKSLVSSCVRCKLQRAKPKIPLMGNLPSGRLARGLRAFSHCGMDYFGPMSVKIGRRREKRWGVIFTCLTVRAVHIELAHSLTTDSAIMAITRMSARRGQPVTIYSDNGTNLRGADKELREAKNSIDADKMHRYATNNEIEWKFIPPGAPHMGGAWERLIGSIKSTLKVILNEQAPREETLLTVLAEIEHIVNSRPLTHVSVDPRDDEALTPNHFLIGSSSGNLTLKHFEIGETCPRKQWRWAQATADAFWKRWAREYLPSLRVRDKWHRETENLKIGDLVLIIDELTQRNSWRKGRIEKVFPGTDGRVRAVEVKTANGILKRPVSKLICFAKQELVQPDK